MAIAIEPGKITVKLFGAKYSPTAYAIRDFLQRSVVAFEWIELQSDEEARTSAQVDVNEGPEAGMLNRILCIFFAEKLDFLINKILCI
jgi:hypothetical protein